ncbi:hypothetical protein TNCV_1461421 [Trichonephila clavipes]|nr:hypothetical protein TNCV_1461421 [Trichonephila clavipes]
MLKVYVKSLIFLSNPQDESGGSIYLATEDVHLSYENDLRRKVRERFQQLQNLEQKYAFLRPEEILNMDKFNLDHAPQDINKEEFQPGRVRL